MSSTSPEPENDAPQPMKSRWCAFVCQDCRAIFRVPADYEGTGVVCPVCDRMLRMPRAGELVSAVPEKLPEVPSEEESTES